MIIVYSQLNKPNELCFLSVYNYLGTYNDKLFQETFDTRYLKKKYTVGV